MKRVAFLVLIITVCLLAGCQVKDDDVISDVKQIFLEAGVTQCTVRIVTHDIDDGTVDTVTVEVTARTTSGYIYFYEGVIKYVYNEDDREWVRENDGEWEVIQTAIDFEATGFDSPPI